MKPEDFNDSTIGCDANKNKGMYYQTDKLLDYLSEMTTLRNKSKDMLTIQKYQREIDATKYILTRQNPVKQHT